MPKFIVTGVIQDGDIRGVYPHVCKLHEGDGEFVWSFCVCADTRALRVATNVSLLEVNGCAIPTSVFAEDRRMQFRIQEQYADINNFELRLTHI